MDHLIQPILIDAALYCVDEQDNQRTERLFTGDGYASTEEIAIIVSGGVATGSMKFGTSCAKSFTIGLNSDTMRVDYMLFELYINDVLAETLILEDEEVDYFTSAYITPSPCGNIIEVVVTLDHDGAAIISSALSFNTLPALPLDALAFIFPGNSQYHPLI